MMRLELFSQTPTFLTDDSYNRVFTLHGIIMVRFFLVPLISTTLRVFPAAADGRRAGRRLPETQPRELVSDADRRPPGAGATLIGGVDTGWTFYPPYSTVYSSGNISIAVIGVIVAGFGTIATGVNFVQTTHTLRAPGLTWFRLPLFVWSIYATSLL